MALARPSVSGGGGGTISGVTAGSGLSGGGTSGTVTVDLDISEIADGVIATADKMLLLDSDGSTQLLESVDDIAGKLPALTAEAAIDVSADYMLFLDGGSSGTAKKEALTDLASAMAGTGLTASSGQLNSSATGTVTSITAAADSGSGSAITSSGTLTYTGGTGVTTSVAGTTVTIDADNNGTVTSITASSDSGSTSAITSSGTITFAGGTNVTTAASGSTVTINSTDQYQGTVTSVTAGADSGSGTAITGSGTLTFTGGTNVTTEVSGTTVTINASGSTDLDSLAAGVIDVSADSFGFIDANDSNASKKESIADFVAAIAGTNLTATNGVLAASGGGGGSAVDDDQNILAIQVFT
jgi:trimeric autotransporter adhesin